MVCFQGILYRLLFSIWAVCWSVIPISFCAVLHCSVDALLSARVKLDITNDYGRTALHLAAVCARGDYVKKLLATGANPNIQDNWGQSSLHAAIGAAVEGAFHVSHITTTEDDRL